MAHHITVFTTLTFGKHKGKSTATVFGTEPSYIYWLQASGYATLDHEVAEAIDAWKVAYPKEAKSVERSVAKMKAAGAITTSVPLHTASPTPAKPPKELLTFEDYDDLLSLGKQSDDSHYVEIIKEVIHTPLRKDTEDPNWGTW